MQTLPAFFKSYQVHTIKTSLTTSFVTTVIFFPCTVIQISFQNSDLIPEFIIKLINRSQFVLGLRGDCGLTLGRKHKRRRQLVFQLLFLHFLLKSQKEGKHLNEEAHTSCRISITRFSGGREIGRRKIYHVPFQGCF